MIMRKYGIIIETPAELRRAEPGPSVLAALLTMSAGLAVLIVGALWFAFFQVW